MINANRKWRVCPTLTRLLSGRYKRTVPTPKRNRQYARWDVPAGRTGKTRSCSRCEASGLQVLRAWSVPSDDGYCVRWSPRVAPDVTPITGAEPAKPAA